MQRAIADQHKIGWDKFLVGFISSHWDIAQLLYREVTGDSPDPLPRSWTEGLISNLWELSHSVWTYRNEIKHLYYYRYCTTSSSTTLSHLRASPPRTLYRVPNSTRYGV